MINFKTIITLALFTFTTVSQAREFRISPRGKKLIKEFETLSLTSYRIKGESSNTIGWGHKINSNDPLWLRRKWVGHKITKREADKLFDSDIEKFINPALNRIKKDLKSKGVNINSLSQDFIDGLASLIYNCGEEGIKSTRFYKHLSHNRIKEAINSVDTTKVSHKGHRSRRATEQAFMKGKHKN